MFQIRWIWKNTDNRHRVLFLTGISLSILITLMLMINPYLTSLLIDRVIIAQDTTPLIPLLLAMLGVQFVRLSLRYVASLMMELSSQHTLYALRRRLFEVLQHQESRFFDRHRTGDLMTRLTGDLEWCRHSMASVSVQAADSIVLFLSTLIFLLFVNWQLTLFLLAVAPLLLVITRVYSKRIRPHFIEMREQLSNMNTAAQENIAGNRVVKAFAREEFEQDRFRQRNEGFRDSNLEINRIWLRFFPLIEGVAGAMTLVAIFGGGLFMMSGRLTPGELTIFTSLSWALANPMRNLGTLINDLQRFFTCANKVIEIYYSRPLIADRPESPPMDPVQGHIAFRDVSFSFGKVPVLDNVSFEVKPGETLGILGPTGAGKTTLIHLLVRLYDVDSGEVLLDGRDVRDWALHSLRAAVGNATQEVFLFSDTVEGNIAFGDLAMSETDVHNFARRADADEFIRKMPQGYDTIVGERGVGLSGGQRQRIALARALAVRPPILVLDDTTSALDMATEKYIQQQLQELPFPCTKIIIGQRVSSLKDADQILVLEDGQITERGTHEELLCRRGYYFETFALQNDLSVLPAEGGVQ